MLWSLNVEEHCYIPLSLIALLPFGRSQRAWPLLTLGLGAIVLHLVYVKFPALASANYALKTEIVASHLLLSAGYFLVRDRIAPCPRLAATRHSGPGAGLLQPPSALVCRMAHHPVSARLYRQPPRTGA